METSLRRSFRLCACLRMLITRRQNIQRGVSFLILLQKRDNLFNIFVSLLRIIKQRGHGQVAEPTNKAEVS